MRKIFLLIIAFALSAGAYAQSGKSIVFTKPDYNTPATNYKLTPANTGVVISPANKTISTKGARTTSTGGRWYSHFNLIDANLGWPFTSTSTTPTVALSPLWWDSTVTVDYSNGIFSTEWGGVGEIIDPIRDVQYNDPNVTDVNSNPLTSVGDIAIGPTNSYTVDSIRIHAAYILERSGKGIVDTLYISVAPQITDFYYDSTGNSWIYHNPGVSSDSTRMFSPQPKYADSVNRAVFADNSASGVTRTLDVFHISADSSGRKPDTTTTPGSRSYFYGAYTFPITANTIPAGQHFAVGISFKSGDTTHHPTSSRDYTQDSITQYNRFAPVYGFELAGSASAWMTYWQGVHPEFQDFNGSCYLDPRGRPSQNLTTYPLVNHSGHPARWLSQYAIQAYNSSTGSGSPDQYLWLDAYITCTNCGTVDVPKVTASVLTNVRVYPNPAADKTTISFALAQPANVSVSLTNMLGQVVASQSFSNTSRGNAEFDVNNLPAGIYFYTVVANGQRFTDRISVTH